MISFILLGSMASEDLTVAQPVKWLYKLTSQVNPWLL